MVASNVVNGVDVAELKKKAGMLQQNPPMAKFEFRVRNNWLGCGHSQTTVSDFQGGGETIRHEQEFKIEADEPRALVGQDQGANPVEHLLNALVTCLTGAMVYHAAVRGIEIQEVESTVEGDLDLRGFMGLAEDVRKGYQNIRVNFKVKADAPKEILEECARFSPVFDVVSNGTNVRLNIEKQ
jgi:uncharacterized OsmC-like protein